jgi:hypothetical protein
VVYLAGWASPIRRPYTAVRVSGPPPATLLIMKNDFPQFDLDEVALLITAVQKALERLKQANEARGGNDPEFVEYGRRYSVILQKLESIAGNH